MKTLKKTLCLVLAVVMVVGVLIIPAGAADYKDYTDKEDIKHEEAVKVLTYLEIVSGTGSGFDPNGKLNRAAGATMLARMMLTRKGADGLPVSETFDDVESAGYSWAAGAISYGVMNGYIRGHGNGKFDPAGALTGYQLAKMLLVAIGYAEPEKYDGAGYETKVYLDATDAGLFDDLIGIDPNKGLTRDDAAQMMFSAMNWSKVAGTTKAYAAFNATEQKSDAFDSFIEAYLVVDQHNDSSEGQDDPWHVESVDPKTGSIIGDKYGLSEGTKADDFKRESKSWKKDGKSVVVLDFVADLEYQGAVTERTILSAMGKNTPSDGSVTFTVYEDGDNGTTKPNQTNNTNNTEVFGGRGSTVQVVIKSSTTANVYVINTYAYQLKSTDILPAKAAVPGVSAAVNDRIRVPSASQYPTQEANGDSPTFDTKEFEKNDVVLYNLAGDKVVGAVKAPVLESGKIVRVDSNGMKINGNYYKESLKLSNTTDGVLGNVTTDGSYVFYGDNQKNIILASKIAPSGTTTKNYIYVFGFAAKGETTTGGTDLFHTGATTSAAQAQAKVIHLDTGVNEIVDLAVTQSGGKWCLVKDDGTADTSSEVTAELTMDSGIHAFALRNDGTYAINVDAEDNSVLTGKLTIKKDTVKTGATIDSKNLIVNSSTEVSVLTLAKNSSDEIVGGDVNYYKGVSNFPNNAVEITNVESLGSTLLLVDAEAGVASRIIIVFAAPDTSEDVTFALYLGEGGKVLNAAGDDEEQLYKFLIDGEVVEVADGASYLTSFAGTTNVGKVYSLTIDDGKVTEETEAMEAVTTLTGEIVVAESNYMVIGESNAYVKLASDCVFVYREGTAPENYEFSVVTDVDADAYQVAEVYTDGTASAADEAAHLVVLIDAAE